jgi:hypothetical protein
MEAWFVDEDPILPVAIEHRCEEIRDGSRLEQQYNYIDYHFESDGAYFWARTYLDRITVISLFGPFDGRTTRRPTGGAIPEAVLAYLRRRFPTVQTPKEGGYAPI